MKPVVFTLEVCPNCERLKEKLTEEGIEYDERDMQDKMSLVDLRVLQCFAREAPVLVIDVCSWKAFKIPICRSFSP